MSQWIRYRAVISVAVIVLLALLLVGGIAQYAYSERVKARQALEGIEPRYARLLGLRDSGNQVEEAVKNAKAAVERLGYASDRDPAKIGNELQQTVRRGFEAARLTIASSQVLTTKIEGGVDRISVAVQAEGALNQLQTVLAALAAESPIIIVDGLTLQPVGRFSDEGVPIVNSRVTLSVLRLQS